jgi:hypothetical protein
VNAFLQAALTAERADEDRSKLEGELAAALAAASTSPDQTVSCPAGRPKVKSGVSDVGA